MSTEHNKEISLSLIEALNARDLGLWSRHLAEDYEAEHPGVSILLDKTRSIAYHQRFVTAFPDIRFEVQGVIADGERVLVQWTASGTHTERLATVTGQTIPRPGGGRRSRARCLPRSGTGRWCAAGSTGTSSRSWPSWGSPSSRGSSYRQKVSRTVRFALGFCGKRHR
jgi:predicted ester cyclase